MAIRNWHKNRTFSAWVKECIISITEWCDEEGNVLLYKVEDEQLMKSCVLKLLFFPPTLGVSVSSNLALFFADTAGPPTESIVPSDGLVGGSIKRHEIRLGTFFFPFSRSLFFFLQYTSTRC